MAAVSVFSRLREAVRDVPAPNRILQSVDAWAARGERVALRYGDAAVHAAEALTARWRPQSIAGDTHVTTLSLDSTGPGAGPAKAAGWRPQPPAGQLTQTIPTVQPSWSYGDVATTLEAHEFGQFMDSATLADAMGRDDRFVGCLNTRTRALAGKSGVGFSVQPSAHGGADRAPTCAAWAKEVGDVWYHVCPENVLTHVMRDAVLFGVSFCRIHWELVGNRRVPRLEPWDLRGIWWDWSIRRYRAIALEGVFTIDPFSAEWLVFEPAGYRSWMWGAIRSLGKPWLIRQFTYRDWARYSEKHGLPILAVKEPTGHQWEKQKTGFWARLKGLGAETTLRLPQDDKGFGFDVELIEAKSRSHAAFDQLLNRLEVNIAVTLLGQNLTTEVQGGSHAAAQAHNQVRLDYLDADAQTLATALRTGVWMPYIRFNGPPGSEEEEAPWPTWQTRPAEDKAAVASRVAQVMSALAAGAQVGLTVPAPWLLEHTDIPVVGLPNTGTPYLPRDGGPADESVVENPDGSPIKSGQPGPPAPAGGGGAAPGSKGAPGAPPIKVQGVPGAAAGARAAAQSDAEAASALTGVRVVALAAGALPERVVGGIKVCIDRPAGFVQHGTDATGKAWERTYLVDYGFVPDTMGGDGDEMDVFVGPNADAAEGYLVAQNHADGSFDEWKLLLGFDSLGDALACYLAHVPAQHLGRVMALPMAALRGLLGQEPRSRAERLSVLWRVARRPAAWVLAGATREAVALGVR